MSVAGCTSAPAPTDNASVTPQDVATSSPALDPDVVLFVSVTATDKDGAAVNLSARVHSSTTWNDLDPSAAIRPEFMASACAPALDAALFERDSWSFALVDISASVPGGGGWPPGLAVQLLPPAGDVPIAAGGIVINDPLATTDSGFCGTSKVVAGAGDGTTVLGFADDAELISWAQQTFGFVAVGSVQLSGCTYTVTTAGAVAAPDSEWSPTSTTSECTVSA